MKKPQRVIGPWVVGGGVRSGVKFQPKYNIYYNEHIHKHVYNINLFYFSYNNNPYVYYTKNKKMKKYILIKYEKIIDNVVTASVK